MTLGADLAPFFKLGEFAVAAVWNPSGGGSPVSESVILNAADSDILAGRQISTAFEIMFPASSGLAAVTEGEVVTVDGVAYEVRESRAVEDGRIMAVSLSAI